MFQRNFKLCNRSLIGLMNMWICFLLTDCLFIFRNRDSEPTIAKYEKQASGELQNADSPEKEPVRHCKLKINLCEISNRPSLNIKNEHIFKIFELNKKLNGIENEHLDVKVKHSCDSSIPASHIFQSSNHLQGLPLTFSEQKCSDISDDEKTQPYSSSSNGELQGQTYFTVGNNLDSYTPNLQTSKHVIYTTSEQLESHPSEILTGGSSISTESVDDITLPSSCESPSSWQLDTCDNFEKLQERQKDENVTNPECVIQSFHIAENLRVTKSDEFGSLSTKEENYVRRSE